MLLLLAIVAVALGVLLAYYIIDKYSVEVTVPEVETEGFLTFFAENQLFVIAVAIVVVILVGIVIYGSSRH